MVAPAPRDRHGALRLPGPALHLLPVAVMLPYACSNPDCPKEGKVVGVDRGKSADCPACGWSMTPVEGGGKGLQRA